MISVYNIGVSQNVSREQRNKHVVLLETISLALKLTIYKYKLP